MRGTQTPDVQARFPSFLPCTTWVAGSWLMLSHARPGFQLQPGCGGGRWAALVECGRTGVAYLGRPECLIKALGTVPALWNIHKAPPAVPGNQGADCSPICSLTFHSRGQSWRLNVNQGKIQPSQQPPEYKPGKDKSTPFRSASSARTYPSTSVMGSGKSFRFRNKWAGFRSGSAASVSPTVKWGWFYQTP